MYVVRAMQSKNDTQISFFICIMYVCTRAYIYIYISKICILCYFAQLLQYELEMWANAQRDGRPAEYRWRPLFNAAVWLSSNAAKTRNPLKFAGVPQTNETISAASRPKFTIL